MGLDIEAIRQSPRQYVDLETVEALADRVMMLEMERDELLIFKEQHEPIMLKAVNQIKALAARVKMLEKGNNNED